MRALLWAAGIATALIVGVYLAFVLSPLPGVWVIQQVFSRGDADLAASSAAQVPAGVIAHTDLAYGAGPDERFDLFLPPAGTARKPLLLVWVHGGGFVAGSKSMPANWLKILASRGYPVVSVEYVRGASRSYPRPARQVNAAIAHVLADREFDLRADDIVLGGDSAGAHIAGQVALAISDPAYARGISLHPAIPRQRLAGMVLVSGIYEMPDLDRGGVVGLFLRSAFLGYTGHHSVADMPGAGLLSIIDNAGPDFPPSFITGGNADALTVQGRKLAARLDGLGVRTDTFFFPDGHRPALAHEYQFRMNTAEGRAAFDRIVAFLDSLRPAG